MNLHTIDLHCSVFDALHGNPVADAQPPRLKSNGRRNSFNLNRYDSGIIYVLLTFKSSAANSWIDHGSLTAIIHIVHHEYD